MEADRWKYTNIMLSRKRLKKKKKKKWINKRD
jgi:hypothetical protein